MVRSYLSSLAGSWESCGCRVLHDCSAPSLLWTPASTPTLSQQYRPPQGLCTGCALCLECLSPHPLTPPVSSDFHTNPVSVSRCDSLTSPLPIFGCWQKQHLTHYGEPLSSFLPHRNVSSFYSRRDVACFALCTWQALSKYVLNEAHSGPLSQRISELLRAQSSEQEVCSAYLSSWSSESPGHPQSAVLQLC